METSSIKLQGGIPHPPMQLSPILKNVKTNLLEYDTTYKTRQLYRRYGEIIFKKGNK